MKEMLAKYDTNKDGKLDKERARRHDQGRQGKDDQGRPDQVEEIHAFDGCFHQCSGGHRQVIPPDLKLLRSAESSGAFLFSTPNSNLRQLSGNFFCPATVGGRAGRTGMQDLPDTNLCVFTNRPSTFRREPANSHREGLSRNRALHGTAGGSRDIPVL